MPRHLVIVESPTKARTMKRYLGPDYIIEASMGHVRDLPQKEFGVDIEHDFRPTYEVSEGKNKVLGTLRKHAAEADVVYLAPDPDREGEAIAWHLKEALRLSDAKAKRVTFDEFTKTAILAAFKEPGVIRMDLVNAQQARRILDRLVGYKISPILSKRLGGRFSAGRVQSVAVRLVVDREWEIRAVEAIPPAFREYWTVKAVFSRKDRREETFEAELKLISRKDAKLQPADLELLDRIAKKDPGMEPTARGVLQRVAKEELRTEAAAHALSDYVASTEYRVISVEQKDQVVHAPPPFSTDLLLRQASLQCSFSAKQTSMLAQQLYEGVEVGSRGVVGLITYMRTDSYHLAPQAIAAARDFIGASYGPEYVPEKPNFYAAGAGAQEAHEAIRPTDVTLTPDEAREYLSFDQYRLYDLIWRRFVACQMPPARFKNTIVEIGASDRVFEARGKQLLFDGFTRVLGRVDKDQILPPLEVGQDLLRHDLAPAQHFVQPPPRYTEATLIKELKKQGIGRPSTYSAILTTIQARTYVELKEEEEKADPAEAVDQDDEEKQVPPEERRKKKRKKFHPTDLGEVVTEKLVEHFPTVLDVAFTRHMEQDLDRIAEAKVGWVDVLKEFNDPFEKDLAKAAKLMKPATRPSPYTCPTCGKPLLQRLSRGSWFLACSGYPKCKFAAGVDSEGKMVLKAEPKLTEFDCPECKKKMVLRDGRWGPFYACSGYPECKKTMNVGFDGRPVDRAGEKTEFTCPKCGMPIVKKTGKRGPFLSCSGYPKCKTIMNIGPDGKPVAKVSGEPTEFKCPKCGGVLLKKSSKRGTFLGCTNYPKCRGTMNIGTDGKPTDKKTAAAQPVDEKCPECGAPMVKKFSRRGPFLACSAYPKCKTTKPLGGGAAAPRAKAETTDIPCPNCGKMMVVREGKWGKFFACSGYPACKTTMKMGPDGSPVD